LTVGAVVARGAQVALEQVVVGGYHGAEKRGVRGIDEQAPAGGLVDLQRDRRIRKDHLEQLRRLDDAGEARL